MWSLGVEMQFYLAIGLAVALFGRRGLWAIIPACAVVSVLRIFDGGPGSIVTHLRVDEILTGGMLALVWLHRDRTRVAKIWAMLPRLFWPALLLAVAASHPAFAVISPLRSYLVAILFGSVMAMETGWVRRLLLSRTLAYLATISFALYVIHPPFCQDWFDSGSDIERYLFKRPISFAAIFLLAHLSTFHFEKPIVDRVKLLSSGRIVGRWKLAG